MVAYRLGALQAGLNSDIFALVICLGLGICLVISNTWAGAGLIYMGWCFKYDEIDGFYPRIIPIHTCIQFPFIEMCLSWLV